MLKVISLLLLPMLLSVTSLPAVSGELEKPMKGIYFHYKKAVDANDAAVMAKHLNEMLAQVELAKQKQMPENKKEKFLEGLAKVHELINSSLQATKTGDIAQAHADLAKINELKKVYHDYAKQKG